MSEADTSETTQKRTLTKSEVINQIYANTAGRISKNDIGAVLVELPEVILSETKKGAVVPLGRIGRLFLVDTNPRVARNPRTGEQINVPAGRALKFRASSTLKKEL